MFIYTLLAHVCCVKPQNGIIYNIQDITKVCANITLSMGEIQLKERESPLEREGR